MADWSDFSDRVDRVIRSSVLADVVTYTVVGGSPASVRGIFAQPGADLPLEGEIVLAAEFPRFGVRLADLEGGVASEGDLLTFNATSVDYRVEKVTPHGVGAWAELALHEV